ncbi:MAG: hypothetical protein ACRECJ_01890 [Limisphaerales bacterium]
MIHIVKLIQKRFPNRSGKVIGTMVYLSLTALILGIGLLLR